MEQLATPTVSSSGYRMWGKRDSARGAFLLENPQKPAAAWSRRRGPVRGERRSETRISADLSPSFRRIPHRGALVA